RRDLRRRVQRRRSPRDLHFTQSSAYGSASSRATGIRSPHMSQIPYVPASMRASARSMSATPWRAFSDSARSRSRSTLSVSPSPDSSSNCVSPCSRSVASASASAWSSSAWWTSRDRSSSSWDRSRSSVFGAMGGPDGFLRAGGAGRAGAALAAPLPDPAAEVFAAPAVASARSSPARRASPLRGAPAVPGAEAGVLGGRAIAAFFPADLDAAGTFAVAFDDALAGATFVGRFAVACFAGVFAADLGAVALVAGFFAAFAGAFAVCAAFAGAAFELFAALAAFAGVVRPDARFAAGSAFFAVLPPTDFFAWAFLAGAAGFEADALGIRVLPLAGRRPGPWRPAPARPDTAARRAGTRRRGSGPGCRARRAPGEEIRPGRGTGPSKGPDHRRDARPDQPSAGSGEELTRRVARVAARDRDGVVERGRRRPST